ncbi:MAG TPA: DUF3870 domain-containing protein [Peptococcaceae bacterium]|nr:DUF3870 domain-containing protein [Peptococcaceae bacterium]
MISMNENTKRRVIVSGHAVAPQGTVLYETKKLITVVLEIDWETGIVLDAETTFMTSLSNTFLKEIIVGRKLPEDFDTIKDLIQRDVILDSRKALIKALSVVNSRFQLLKMNEFSHLKKQCQM